MTLKASKNVNSYICEECNFICSRAYDYNRHIKTAKHKSMTNNDIKSVRKTEQYECVCGKIYKHRQGLHYHKKTCTSQNQQISDEIINQPVQSLDTGLVIELLKQNQEFKELMIDQNKQLQQSHEQNNELQKQLLEAVKDGKTINNNNTINNTTNNRFNLNVFLNETCKDAINLNDFIQSIVLNIDDFINTGEVGYVKGISNIMVERIRDMEPHIRPIHCTDLKREIVYVKDSNIWAKEDANKTHLRKAIRIVADKNKNLVHSWIEENPNYEILDTPECDKYFEYTKASLGGYGREEDRKFENKIINNILKETVIDKKMIE